MVMLSVPSTSPAITDMPLIFLYGLTNDDDNDDDNADNENDDNDDYDELQ